MLTRLGGERPAQPAFFVGKRGIACLGQPGGERPAWLPFFVPEMRPGWGSRVDRIHALNVMQKCEAIRAVITVVGSTPPGLVALSERLLPVVRMFNRACRTHH